METNDVLDGKVLTLLKAGTAHLLEAKSGVPGEDLHQFLYLHSERNSSETTPRQMELLCYLDAATKARGLVFKQITSKLAVIPEILGLLCKDDGVPVARARLFIKLMFGETHPKTKTLLEEICLGSSAGEDEATLGLKQFETYMKALLLAKEASDVAGDVFDHLVLLKGAKAKVGRTH